MQEEVEKLRLYFEDDKTLSYKWREVQLKALQKCMLENEKEFCEALFKDLHKCNFESIVTELALIHEEISTALKNLGTWMKPNSISRAAPKYLWLLDSLETFPEPFGVVLIISPWNYPIQLALAPLIGAIAAGNCVVLKPSEISNHCETILSTLLPKYLDTEAFAVITGGVPETQELLTLQFDYIFYTGSTKVGKIIMKAASEYLTPVTLELGGKSPVIIHESGDIELAAKRISWGKFLNSGQSCIAPDYVLIAKEKIPEFIRSVEAAVIEMFSEQPKDSPDYGRIISDMHFDRLVGYLEDGEISFGGSFDKEKRYIAPTVLTNVSPESSVMQEEIFGPILPIIGVESLDEAIRFIRNRPKPLSLYLFASHKGTIKKVQRRTFSGSFVTNDTVIQFTCNTLPFGGIGESGMGGYHGEHSFNTFSHVKSVLHKTTHMEFFNDYLRYPPYSKKKLSKLQTALRYPN